MEKIFQHNVKGIHNDRDPFFIIFMTRETKELYNMTMKNSQNLSQSTFSKNYFYWKNLRRLAKKKKDIIIIISSL